MRTTVMEEQASANGRGCTSHLISFPLDIVVVLLESATEDYHNHSNSQIIVLKKCIHTDPVHLLACLR